MRGMRNIIIDYVDGHTFSILNKLTGIGARSVTKTIKDRYQSKITLEYLSWNNPAEINSKLYSILKQKEEQHDLEENHYIYKHPQKDKT